MRTFLSSLIAGALVLFGAFFWVRSSYPEPTLIYPEPPRMSMWPIQSIDTMKYSRDIARERLHDKSFDIVIERQGKAIAETGATHIALATPYDEEFVPFLKRWVAAARVHGLNVWFRGNLSGWEGWFGYPKITREEHIQKTQTFIASHPELFADGDIFVSCPECENGGPGDPRQTGDTEAYRAFLIASAKSAADAFQKIGKKVDTNLASMNGDVARLVMDKATTKALGGSVTIDHYVRTPEQLVRDAAALALKSAGQIVLGEFGAPIPDIHGTMTEDEQVRWIDGALEKLSTEPSVRGINYWLSVGGSTELWTADGKPKKAVAALTRYFKPHVAYGFVRDGLGRPIGGAELSAGEWSTKTDKHGYFSLRYLPTEQTHLIVRAPGYEDVMLAPREARESLLITPQPTVKPFYYDTAVFLRGLFIK